MSGTAQASRNANDLVTDRLIAKSALGRYGGSWDEHPLSEWPTSIVTEGGRPRFLYRAANGGLRTFAVEADASGRTQRPWHTEPPPILVETFVSGEVIETTAYDETGEMLHREVAVQ